MHEELCEIICHLLDRDDNCHDWVVTQSPDARTLRHGYGVDSSIRIEVDRFGDISVKHIAIGNILITGFDPSEVNKIQISTEGFLRRRETIMRNAKREKEEIKLESSEFCKQLIREHKLKGFLDETV